MLLPLLASWALAGGGPANTLVLYNADDPAAVDVALHYDEARQLPPGHLCGLSGLDPLARSISWEDYLALVRAPLEACLDALPQPEEIDVLVTVRGLPYEVLLPSFTSSLQATLQVHHALDPTGAEIAGQGHEDLGGYAAASVPNPLYDDAACTDLLVDNPYATWYRAACALTAASRLPRSPVRDQQLESQGYVFDGDLFVVSRLDGFDHADAHDLIERGLAADGTFPAAPFLCMEGGDEARAARDPECEYTVRMLQAVGESATWVAPHDPALAGHEVVAYFTGSATLTEAIDGQTYVPGAVACNLTSFGAKPQNFFCSDDGTLCPESESQTSIARFVRAGATGAHGTVEEPLNNSFPNAGALLLYASGYALGESFLLSQRYLYWQNLLLGDPLTSPFAERPTLELPDAVSEGAPLVVSASHTDGISEVRLYADGVRVADAEGDVLSWEHGLVGGDTVELLAVAVAASAEVPRPGWPVSSQKVRADVQGWTTVQLAVTPPEALPPEVEPPEEAGAADDDEARACGCASAASPSLLPVPLLFLLLRCRRRRTG